MAEYIAESKPLGGLIFLLPQMFRFENKGGTRGSHQDGSKELLKNALDELEQRLIHTNLPVSKFQTASPISRLMSYFSLLDLIKNKVLVYSSEVVQVNCLVHEL